MVLLKQFNKCFHIFLQNHWQYKTLTCGMKISACCHSFYFCVTCFFWMKMLRITLLSSSCETEWKKKDVQAFPRPFTHGGGGGQSVNGGGLMRGDIHLMGGPKFDTLYHKLKVLLMLSCNYMMQFIGYDSIKIHWFISYRFQIRTITQHQYKRIGAINRIV